MHQLTLRMKTKIIIMMIIYYINGNGMKNGKMKAFFASFLNLVSDFVKIRITT